MKKIIQPFIVLLLLVMSGLTACTNYGKKVEVAGTKGEVYYKGDGVLESDAKRLGDYLKEVGFFDNTTKKTAQLIKAKDAGFDVHFVVDQTKLKTTANVEDGFVAVGALISKNVFGNVPVNIFLSDDHLKDIKSLPYDKKKAEALLTSDEPKTEKTPDENTGGGLEGYQSHVESGVKFYWKTPVTDAEAETIGNAIIKTGAFAGAEPDKVNIIMEKEGDRYLVKFPVAIAYQTDPSYLATMEKVGKQIKDAAFANVPYSFVMTDTNLNTVKSFDY